MREICRDTVQNKLENLSQVRFNQCHLIISAVDSFSVGVSLSFCKLTSFYLLTYLFVCFVFYFVHSHLEQEVI